MKCNECGSTGFSGSSCPDCGSDKVVEITGAATPTPTSIPAPEPEPAMPDVDLTAATTPVVGTIKLPDGRGVEMRDGDSFSVADEGTDQDVTFRTTGDPTVSSKPIYVAASGGRAKISGGGSNGFALDITLRIKTGEVQVPKTVDEVIALLQGGATFAAVALKAGKDTRLPLKF